MSEFDTHPLLLTDTVTVRDVRCEGTCKHKSGEEFVTATHLVFPYRGIYVRHVGRADAIADANQVVLFNEGTNPIGSAIPLTAGIQAYRSESAQRCCLSSRPFIIYLKVGR